jgi:hypothetical protein
MSPIDNLADRLARVQSAFDAAPVGFDNQPPDGDYQTLVHDFDFFQGGTPRRAYMKMRLQVQHHPEEAGRFAEKVYSIEEEDGIGYLKADLHRLGVNVQGMNIGQAITSGALAEELYDVPVLVRVKRPAGKTNKRGEQVVNVYIQRRLGDPDRSARRDLERNGASDVPEPAAASSCTPSRRRWMTCRSPGRSRRRRASVTRRRICAGWAASARTRWRWSSNSRSATSTVRCRGMRPSRP